MAEVMRSASLIRTRSFTGSGVYSLRRNRSAVESAAAAWAALHFQPKQRKEEHLLRRARSEADIAGSNQNAHGGLTSPIPAKVVEEEEEKTDLGATGFDLSLGMWPSGVNPVVVGEEVEYSGGGMGKGRKIGGGRGSGGGDGAGDGCGQDNDNRRTSDYYQQMLKSDPSNPLLLRNYGEFLHEVMRDMKGAEEYYSRAILASPGDGEVLSLFGKLMWEVRRDVERAENYFERAVEASPNNCYVLGSYAQFLWDAEDEEEAPPSSPLVEAV